MLLAVLSYLFQFAHPLSRRLAAEPALFPHLNGFRSLSDEGRCQFILAGFWRLYRSASFDYTRQSRTSPRASVSAPWIQMPAAT
jgi:hypothetical protein